jgi:beta-glucuronidase
MVLAGLAAGASQARPARKSRARCGRAQPPLSARKRHAIDPEPGRHLAFRADPKDVGEAESWQKGLKDFRLIPVPASWNDIFDDVRNYVGSAWYETDFRVDKGWAGQRIHLRFGSVNYTAKVWLNGKLLGGRVGGHLPFAFDITDAVSLDGDNVLTVLVENKIQLDRVPSTPTAPAGTCTRSTSRRRPTTSSPMPAFIGRCCCSPPPTSICSDVTVKTSLDGKLSIDLQASAPWSGKASVTISDDKGEQKGVGDLGRAARVRPWSR